MPRKVGYKKKPYKRRRPYVRRKRPYRLPVARIARPLTRKPRSAMQNVLYYNSFRCQPKIDPSRTSGDRQRNFFLKLNLNSVWPFDAAWDSTANTAYSVCTPNEAITGYALPVTDAMTMMPNVRDGSGLFAQYSQCAVVGTKVTIVATPINNDSDVQLGYLYAVKHSQPGSGMDANSSIVELQKLPYRQMSKLMGPDAPTSGFESGRKVGARLVVKHSPKHFNNVKDIRDNKSMFNSIGSNGSAHKPTEADYLTIGVLPALNGLDRQVTDFCLQVRVEQRLLFTEPLESISTGTGNYSFPWRATLAAGAVTGAGMWL